MMKHYWALVEVPNDNENPISFVIKLRSGCRFKLNNCYFTIYKSWYNEFHNSDYFRIDLVIDADEKHAENVMRRSIDLLVYITGVPYELDYLREDIDINIQPINMNMSKEKLSRLALIDAQYNRTRHKKELLENVLRLYSLATKYMILLEDSEEAYFAMFRVIEKIAKDEFGIEHGNVDNGFSVTRSMINNLTQNIYGVKFTSNKLDDLAGNFSATLKDMVFSDIYAKIAWFCGRKNIFFDEGVLSRAVKLRNKHAHGDNVHIDNRSREYDLVLELATKFIYEKFFCNLKHCYLEAKMDI